MLRVKAALPIARAAMAGQRRAAVAAGQRSFFGSGEDVPADPKDMVPAPPSPIPYPPSSRTGRYEAGRKERESGCAPRRHAQAGSCRAVCSGTVHWCSPAVSLSRPGGVSQGSTDPYSGYRTDTPWVWMLQGMHETGDRECHGAQRQPKRQRTQTVEDGSRCGGSASAARASG
jgi:hypothetical protein